jgi:hypothetical protein
VAQESAHESGGSADATPVVVPQRGNEPRSVGREHQVGQGTVGHWVVPAPGGGLLWPRLYQHVVPSGIQRHHRRTGKHHVIYAGVKITKPPRLARRVLAQQRPHGPVTLFRLFAAVRQHDRGVGVEDQRDGSGDGPADGCAAGDPRDLGVSPDPPGSAVSGQPDRQHGRRRRSGIKTWPGHRYRMRLLSSHAISLDPPGTGEPGHCRPPRDPRQPTDPPGRPPLGQAPGQSHPRRAEHVVSAQLGAPPLQAWLSTDSAGSGLWPGPIRRAEAKLLPARSRGRTPGSLARRAVRPAAPA